MQMQKQFPQKKLHLALSFLLLSQLAIIKPGHAQLPPEEYTPENIEKLAKYIQKECTGPVIDNLLRRAGGDQELIEWLRQIELWTKPEPPPGIGAGAFATYKAGKPIVYIDLIYINEMFDYADVASLALTGQENAMSIFIQAFYNYDMSLKSALQNKSPIPRFSFKIDHSITDPALKTVAKRLALEAFFGGIAWVILHEVSHHRLGHTQKHTFTLKDKRLDELAADRGAFVLMERMGYNLAPLNALFVAKEFAQKLRIRAKIEPPEYGSTHPIYATRNNQLEQLFDVKKATKESMPTFLTLVSKSGDSYVAYELIVPRDPDSEGWLFAIASTNEYLPYEWKYGKIFIYGRDEKSRSEIIIHEPDKFAAKATIRIFDRHNILIEEKSGIFIQVDYAWSQHLQVGPTHVYSIFANSPIKNFRKYISQVEHMPSVINNATQIHLDQLRETRQVLIRYAKGELTEESIEGLIKTISTKGSEQLQNLLGMQKFERLKNITFSDPLFQFGLDIFISKKTKSRSP